MDPVARLVAIEEIHQLKARYFRCMDTKQWAELAEVFATDAVFDARNSVRDGNDEASRGQQLGPEWIWRGRAEIAAAIESRTGPVITIHHGHMMEVEVHDETTASGVVAMEDVIATRSPDGCVTGMQGWGHYVETYRVEDGRWRIATSRLDRLRVDRARPPAP